MAISMPCMLIDVCPGIVGIVVVSLSPEILGAAVVEVGDWSMVGSSRACSCDGFAMGDGDMVEVNLGTSNGGFWEICALKIGD
ncbi:hypothetical protein O6P43_014697 [Quillaja saponaria]|uniref:Uncharacterized protein n=1 Tax=Quillaja saponaria TaxID=32244 RepID=A0AAD7LV90_QUISA|nr:hypothetical protein O6P43_014697 [Quillaja saponaria]